MKINPDSMHELDTRNGKILIEYVDVKEIIQESSCDYSTLK